MAKRLETTRILSVYFFQRFFDNDTIQVEGDTVTTVVRVLAATAIPGLVVAFFLQNQYPQRTRWGAIEDQYFFVMFSFVVMGALTLFQWETLFPDRIDFLVLSPLPLQPRQMLSAKSAALAAFIGLFLVGANALGAFMYVAVAKGPFLRQIVAHGSAVLLAGEFAALAMLAINGVLRCVLGTVPFRVVSPFTQMLLVALLALLVLLYVQGAEGLEALLSGERSFARWFPPLWFLGVYDHILYGASAPAFAAEMARYAVTGTAAAALVVLLTYPVAWERMRRMAIEEAARNGLAPSRAMSWVVYKVVSRPAERAAFSFIGQTLRRNSRYQVYLATYCGTGLALAVACAVRVRLTDGLFKPSLSVGGLHAVTPLLLFWGIAGLRNAFALPMNLSARWVFRITGADADACSAAAGKWAFLFGLACLLGILGVLCFEGCGARQLGVQVVFGLCLCVLLTDGFFFERSIAFTRPRLPGKKNFPLMLTLYVGVLGPFVFGVVWLEMRMEQHTGQLIVLGCLTAAVHLAQRLSKQEPMEVEEEMEAYEGEFQLLHLS